MPKYVNLSSQGTAQQTSSDQMKCSTVSRLNKKKNYQEDFLFCICTFFFFIKQVLISKSDTYIKKFKTDNKSNVPNYKLLICCWII